MRTSSERGTAHPDRFIGLETIRLFEPEVYRTIRNYPKRFAGCAAPADRNSVKETGAFHKGWLNDMKLDERRESALKSVLDFLFPMFAYCIASIENTDEEPGQNGKSSTAHVEEDLRLCNPDVFSYVLSMPLD